MICLYHLSKVTSRYFWHCTENVVCKLSLLVVHILKRYCTVLTSFAVPLDFSVTTGVFLLPLLSFRPTLSAPWSKFWVTPLWLPSLWCRRSCQCLLMHSCCKSITWTLMIKISSLSRLKKLWEVRKRKNLDLYSFVSFMTVQFTQGSDYNGALSIAQNAATHPGTF